MKTSTPNDTDAIAHEQSPFQHSLQRLGRDLRAIISLGIILFFVFLALIGPPLYLRIGTIAQNDLGIPIGPAQYHSFSYQVLSHEDELPSRQYWLGTDALGRDLLARLMQGLRLSLLVALLVEIVHVLLGVTCGMLAGYYGGWIDQFLARFMDVLFAFPRLLFVLVLTGVFSGPVDSAVSTLPIIGPNGYSRLLLVSLLLAFTSWPLLARYIRGQTLQLKHYSYIEAAHASGTRDRRMLFSHILPHLVSLIIVVSTLNIGSTIMAEAGISLLGLGVRPPGSSLGLMIAEGATQLASHPWEAFVPSLTLAFLVLAFSFLGDSLRDAFDPRLSNSK